MNTLGEKHAQVIKISYTKLLEIVGSSMTFEELLDIIDENKTNSFWLNTYTITDSQFIDWIKYVLEKCREIIPEQTEYSNHMLISFICNMINEWHFPVIKD